MILKRKSRRQKGVQNYPVGKDLNQKETEKKFPSEQVAC